MRESLFLKIELLLLQE